MNVLYIAVKHQWPENYFQIDSTADPIISRNMPRYLLFRFIPPFLVFCAAAVTADRVGGMSWLAVVAAVTVHALSLVLAIVKALIRRVRYRLAFGRILIVLILCVLGWLACEFRNVFKGLIPTPGELVGNFWAGAIAAVGAVFLTRVALVKHDPLSLAYRATRDIRGDLFQYVNDQAKKSGVDATLVTIFMIAEDIQRPKWYRRVESIFPGARARTTGIMQQSGARTDRESIDLALANCFVPVLNSLQLKRQAPDFEDEMLEECLRTQSEDPGFHNLVRGLYYNLSTDKEWKQLVALKIRGRN